MRSIIILCFLTSSLFAQTPYFEKTFGTQGNDVARSVKQIGMGSIFVLGSSDTLNGGDITLSKLDAAGNLMWTKYYGTANIDNGFYLNLAFDGNLVFTGESEAASNDLDVVMYKVDTNGAVIWSRRYATPLNETAKYIEQTADGGYVLAGAQNDAFGMYDMLALKLDAGGNLQWAQTFGRNENDYADAIHQQGSNYILTGDTRSFGAGGYDVMLFDLDSLGNEIWSQTYGDTLNNGCQGLLLTSDHHYISYGETEIAPSSAFDFYLQKIDTNGVSVWRHTYGGTGADAVFSVREDMDGGFVCTGYSNSYNGFDPLDLVVFKVDSAGTFLWKQTYGGSGIDIGYELIPSVDGNGFIIAGKTFGTTDDYYLLKLDRDGLLSGIDALDDNNDALFQVFPNPADDVAAISYKLHDAKDVTFTVRDITGKLITTQNITSPEGAIKLDVSALSEGMYLCIFQKGKEILAARRLVVVR